MMSKAIHSMIRVQDEARSVAFYKCAFGLEVADRLDFESFTLIYMSNGETPFELELTVNKGHGPYDLGDGYGHLALSVSDIDGEHARFTSAGFNPTPLRELSLNGRGTAKFFFVQDPDGYKIEVLQRGGRYL